MDQVGSIAVYLTCLILPPTRFLKAQSYELDRIKKATLRVVEHLDTLSKLEETEVCFLFLNVFLPKNLREEPWL